LNSFTEAYHPLKRDTNVCDLELLMSLWSSGQCSLFCCFSKENVPKRLFFSGARRRVYWYSFILLFLPDWFISLLRKYQVTSQNIAPLRGSGKFEATVIYIILLKGYFGTDLQVDMIMHYD
jgi:hypothetical protein